MFVGKNMKCWFVILVSLVLVAIGAIVFVFFFHWVDLVIDHELPLSETSMTFQWWRKPPVNPVMRVYVYNVTNADEFLNNGSKPIVEELGPYVYVETWEKVHLRFNENKTVSFNQRKIFVFDPEQSAGTEDDMVVVPNIPMLSATSQSKHAARFLRLAMASIMDILKVKPFVEVSVGQLLWGYEDPLIKLAKDVVPNDQKLPYEQFGLLYGLQKLAMREGVRDAAQLLAVVPLKRLAATLATVVAAAAEVAVTLLSSGLESQARHVALLPPGRGSTRAWGLFGPSVGARAFFLRGGCVVCSFLFVLKRFSPPFYFRWNASGYLFLHALSPP